MAIFHLSVKVFSRAKCHSAVAAASYRAGVNMRDERTGELHEYAKRKGVIREASALVLPKGAPRWSRVQLWNAVEQAETRKNSTVAREVEVSLPYELTSPQRIELAHEFTQWLVAEYGVAAEVNVHQPTPKKDDARNHHAHIQLSTRRLGENGFEEKIRVLDAIKTGAPEILKWREEWSKRVNEALEMYGHEARIDHRSNASRELDALPTVHVGHGPRAPQRQELNIEISAWNAEATALRDERARVQSLIAFEQQLAETRVALDATNAESLRIKELLARSEPAREVNQARKKANDLLIAIRDKKITVKTAREQLDALPWYRLLTKRAMNSRIENGEAQLVAWSSDYREIKRTSNAPVRDGLAKQQAELDKKRETLLKLRDDLTQKIAEAEEKNNALKHDKNVTTRRFSSTIPP